MAKTLEPEIITCKHCQCPVKSSKALVYQSRNYMTGVVQTLFVCSNSCLIDAFNQHHQSGNKEEILSTNQPSQNVFEMGLYEMAHASGPLND